MRFKYQGVAKVGDRIRAYDFECRSDAYVEGTVHTVDASGSVSGPAGKPYACFVIQVDKDQQAGQPPYYGPGTGSRVGHIVCVPMQCAWGEWEGRVIKLSK